MTNLTCISCKNYIKDNICLAFINGIDISILEGKNDHSKILKSQSNNIVYQKRLITEDRANISDFKPVK